MSKTENKRRQIRVKDDLARGGYEGNIYQRPKKGENVRYPGRTYFIGNISICEGDTTLSLDYIGVSVIFFDGEEPSRETFNLTEILNDVRVKKRTSSNRATDYGVGFMPLGSKLRMVP